MHYNTLLFILAAVVLLVGAIVIAQNTSRVSVSDNSGTRVEAPGTTVESDREKTRIQAPGVDVTVPRDKDRD